MSVRIRILIALSAAAAVALPSQASSLAAARPHRVVPASVYFCDACWHLTPSAKRSLKRLRPYVARAAVLRVSARASGSGPSRFNTELSRRRALVVKRYLLKGVRRPHRVVVHWYGTVPSPSPARGRRADILIFI